MRKAIITTASVMGSRPKKYEEAVNQDAFFVKESDEYICAVVSDGAGSHRYAALGARIFCDEVGNYLITNANSVWSEKPEKEISGEVATVISETTEKLISENGGTARDYGSTLMFALIKKGHKEILLGNLGDGVIGIEYGEKEAWKESKSGDRIRQRYFNILSFPIRSGRATFLTNSIQMKSQLRIERKERGDDDCPFRQLFLATDGCYDHCFESGYGMGYNLLGETLQKVYTDQPEDDATFVTIEW